MASSARCLRAQPFLRPSIRSTRTQPILQQRWHSHIPFTAPADLSTLEHSMIARKIPPIFDDLTPQSSYRLDTTLCDFLPSSPPPPILSPTSPNPRTLPIPHHLIYFEPTKPSSVMLADGTNPDQSPGEPFVRRMWAGGRVLYNHSNPLILDGSRGVCAEFIRSVSIKGKPGSEKIFVRIERRQAKATADEEKRCSDASRDEQAREDLQHRVRQRLWRDGEEEFGECSVLEARNIVFMRSRTPAEAKAEGEKSQGKMLKPQLAPDWSYTITPDPKLLFRFSALTFNAHAIHLDPRYCQEVEGHRDLLFHGPLSYVFMVSLLQKEMAKLGAAEVVRDVEYRNLAPLYCKEPVTFCGTRTGERKWEVWTQTPEGGIAVKGSVGTEAAR